MLVSEAELPSLKTLIRRQKPGYSLEQPFYVAPEVFEYERRGFLTQQWFILAHASELARPQSHIVRDLLGESIVITRDAAGAVRGFYNVCRHRGSQVCDSDGSGHSLVCPYHAWSYRLDGSLRSAPALPAAVKSQDLGLKPISVVEVGGLILGSLKGTSDRAQEFQATFAMGLAYHGVDTARIAARRRYPTRGNWKLVVENFVECYHCMAAHPEYCSVMSHVSVLARTASVETQKAWQASVDAWWSEHADRESPLQRAPADFRLDACAASRAPIGNGFLTQSQDGKPVAPLMGCQTHFDGGASVFRCEPFVFVAALNDHSVMFQFAPRAAQETEVTVTWLVAGDATDGAVDVERMLWLWDVTTKQDKTLIERNALGIGSSSYEPGPYTELESLPARFVARYLQELAVGADMSRQR